VIDLLGRRIVVTGAGRGLGKAIAIAAADADAHVIVTSRTETGKKTAQAIVDQGGSAEWLRCDVTNAAQVEDVMERAGVIDGVVHNATSRLSNVPAALTDVDRDAWHEHSSVSLLGAYHCASSAFPRLTSRGGRFVVMTSPAGMEGSLTNPLYGTVKGALRGFTKSLAREWAPYGHTVTAVSPLAATEALVDAFENDPGLEPRLSTRVPLGRVGDPIEDVAPAVLFLLSDEARYITGQTLVVDGGRFLWL
jgi:3-oxoacyl-[acyl-carrier protein] reductase